MKKKIVTTVQSKIFIPESSIENFFNTIKKCSAYRAEHCQIPEGNFETVEWRTAHAPVSGIVAVDLSFIASGHLASIKLPVQTRFIVTCIKSSEGSYKVALRTSLS